MSLIAEGRPAPTFSLPDQHGQEHSLADYAGRPVVLFFYPKDDTPGCTAEACNFRDQYVEFQKLNAAVLGISPDGVSSHASFVAKHDLPFTLLADEPDAGGTPAVCDAYGVWQERSMYGRRHMGVARTTYLIDPQGKVAKCWDNVKVAGHVETVLDAIGSLAS